MRAFRILAAVLLGLAVSVVPACRSGSTGKLKVAFVSNNSFEFWKIAQKGTEKAAKEFDVEVLFRTPPGGGTPADQQQIIDDLLTMNVKGIAVSPVDADNQGKYFDRVAEQVDLLTQDSDLPPGSKRRCYIGTDNYQAGRDAGKLVKRAIPDGGKVLIVVGKLEARNAIERRQGVLDELAGEKDAAGPRLGDKYELAAIGSGPNLGTITDGGDDKECVRKVEDTLGKAATRDVKCIVGLWEYNPPAILKAVDEAKRTRRKAAAAADAIAIVGFDENDATLQGIRDGDIEGTIVQQPFEFGYHSVRILAALARGDQSVVPASGLYTIKHQTIDRNNVDEFHQRLKELTGKR